MVPGLFTHDIPRLTLRHFHNQQSSLEETPVASKESAHLLIMQTPAALVR